MTPRFLSCGTRQMMGPLPETGILSGPFVHVEDIHEAVS